jgi:trans-aconitate methyltransferase
MNTDKAWKRYGEIDPYFGVFPHANYHSSALTDRATEEFFRSGEAHVQRIMKTLREIDHQFSPSSAVDFGCGVGRVTLPLALEAPSVLGVDVSPGMLSEARKNAIERGVSNVRFAHEVSGRFDLVHSFIVLGHIPPRRGLGILRDLLSRLESGGMIVLQVPYDWHATAWRRLATRVKRVDPITQRVVNLAKRRPLNYPNMAIFSYDLRAILSILRESEIDAMRITLDSSGDYSNATICGQRARRVN